MKKSKSHQIDENGKRLLGEQLPSTWVVNEQFNDYGKDFIVEIADAQGELTGDSFHIQLKSCDSAKLISGGKSTSFPLKSNHARYFAKIKDLPVFLVVMDVSRKVGVYLFLQEWLASNTGYLNQSSISVPVLNSNVLEDTNSFSDEIKRAKEWLKARHPASLQNSAAAEVARLKALDPRFDVKTRIDSGKVHHELLPNTSFQTTFRTREGKREAAEKLRQFIEFGETVNFEPGEFNIDGSALLQQAELEGCQLSRSPINAKLRIIAEVDGRSASLVLDGKLTGGERLLFLEATEANSPVRLQLEIREQSIGFTLQFDAKVWEGKCVSKLPHFSSCRELVRCLNSPQNLEFVVERDGNEVIRIPCPYQVDRQITAIDNLISDLQRVRKLCSHYRVDPCWSMIDFCQQYFFFCQVEDLTFNGFWKGPCVSSKSETILSGEKLVGEIKKYRKTPGPITITSNMSFSFLGLEILLGRIAKDFTNMQLKKCRRLKGKDEYKVQFIATEQTMLTMRKAASTENVRF